MQVDMMKLIELSSKGYHCSQIIAALALEFREEDNPSLVRAMSALNGGMGFTENCCGVLTACTTVIGLFAGKGSAEETSLENFNGMIASFVDWFKDENEHRTDCSLIRGTKGPLCSDLILDAYLKVMEILAEGGALNDF